MAKQETVWLSDGTREFEVPAGSDLEVRLKSQGFSEKEEGPLSPLPVTNPAEAGGAPQIENPAETANVETQLEKVPLRSFPEMNGPENESQKPQKSAGDKAK